MGSDESHFNVSVGSDGQSVHSVHKPQPFWREKRAEAVSNQPNALPLGQTGSQWEDRQLNYSDESVCLVSVIVAAYAFSCARARTVHAISHSAGFSPYNQQKQWIQMNLWPEVLLVVRQYMYLISQVEVTVGDSGLCCHCDVRATSHFEC